MAEVKEIIERLRKPMNWDDFVAEDFMLTYDKERQITADALSTLLQECDELREALRPFAEAAELFSDRNKDGEPAGAWIHTNDWEKERIPRVRDLRRAARALADKGVR